MERLSSAKLSLRFHKGLSPWRERLPFIIGVTWDPLRHMSPREKVPKNYPAHNNTASRWLRRLHLHHILNLFPWCSQCVNRVSWCLVLTKMFHAETKSYLVFSLSNDPGKKGSDFFCYVAIRCPHIAKFSFLHREYVNLQKRRTTK